MKSPKLRQIPRDGKVHVVHGMRADMFRKRFVKPAFQTSLAIAVSTVV